MKIESQRFKDTSVTISPFSHQFSIFIQMLTPSTLSYHLICLKFYISDGDSDYNLPVQFETQDSSSKSNAPQLQESETVSTSSLGKKITFVKAFTKTHSKYAHYRSRPSETAKTDSLLPYHGAAKGSSTTGFKCRSCSKSFESLLNARYHMISCPFARHRKFTCYFCGRTFDDKSELTAHEESHNRQCPECKKKFPSTTDMQAHLASVHTMSQCVKCFRLFRIGQAFENHIRNWNCTKPTGQESASDHPLDRDAWRQTYYKHTY